MADAAARREARRRRILENADDRMKRVMGQYSKKEESEDSVPSVEPVADDSTTEKSEYAVLPPVDEPEGLDIPSSDTTESNKLQSEEAGDGDGVGGGEKKIVSDDIDVTEENDVQNLNAETGLSSSPSKSILHEQGFSTEPEWVSKTVSWHQTEPESVILRQPSEDSAEVSEGAAISEDPQKTVSGSETKTHQENLSDRLGLMTGLPPVQDKPKLRAKSPQPKKDAPSGFLITRFLLSILLGVFIKFLLSSGLGVIFGQSVIMPFVTMEMALVAYLLQTGNGSDAKEQGSLLTSALMLSGVRPEIISTYTSVSGYANAITQDFASFLFAFILSHAVY